ncbi:MAG: hypothetical protein ACYC8S_00520 [Minisyncoccota bacterium]
MQTSKQVMGVGAILLVLIQWTIDKGYGDPFYIRTFLVVVGAGAILVGFSQTMYFLIANKNSQSPATRFDSNQTQYQTMRLPFKIMLGIFSVLVVLPLLGMLILLVASYFGK